ncbi:hypothetical protein [Enterococcus faecium]|uniref:hypothetical protein n=1 Tax=Enterococcus faecium TaxID=1352 RepID=UPI0019FB5E3E|nr:hypothetical protein [Enterococcus faecium]MCD9221786.1 hypothetical protein [Enterococcus lactis]
MNPSSLTEIIFSAGNLLLLFLSLLFNFYQFKSNQKEKVSSEIAERVIKQIFIPYQNSLGIYLYKKITPQNWEKLRNTLIHFKETLDCSTESYYLSDAIQLSINKLSLFLKLDHLNKKEFKHLNKQFQKFSKSYLREHSHFRETLHLPIKGALHRLQFKLYSSTWNYLYLMSKLGLVVIIFLIIFVPLYLILVLHLLSWLYPFLSP